MIRFRVDRSTFNEYRSLKISIIEIYSKSPYLVYPIFLVVSYKFLPSYFLIFLILGLPYFVFFGFFFNFYLNSIVEISEKGIHLKNSKEDLYYSWDDIIELKVLKDRLPNNPQRVFVIVLYLEGNKALYFTVTNLFFVSSRTRLNELIEILNQKSSNKYKLNTKQEYSYTDTISFFREIEQEVIYMPT